MRAREILGRRFLIEADLSKGAKFVLNDKKVVANVADMLRTDQTVPPTLRTSFRRMKDIDVATWFVEQLDDLERKGVGGVIFSRDGKNHFWIARTYGNGGSIWEDIKGEYPEAMRDYMILKNRNLLDPKHNDVQKFKGVKDLHRYMVVHYEQMLTDLRKDAELAAFIKNKRSVRVVDNDDYSIYLLQNRGAACAFGKGATYCTANSREDYNWKSYSAKAAIFGLVPKQPKPITGISAYDQAKMNGVPEKYQFDAGSGSLHDVLDRPADPTDFKERFPYFFTDLIKGLKEHKKEIEEPEEEPGIDKLKYNVDKEIALIRTNLSRYITDKVRPKPKADGEEPESPEAGPVTTPVANVANTEPVEEPIVPHQVPRNFAQ